MSNDQLSNDVQTLSIKVDNVLNYLSNLSSTIDYHIANLKVDHQGSVAMAGITAAGVAARSQRLRQPYQFDPPQMDPSRTMDIAAQLARLKELNPRLFATWWQLFENGRKAYETTVVGNLSHHGNPYSRLFSCYVEIFAKGAILDIGTGPMGIPSYLSSFPAAAVFGVEPIVQVENSPSLITQGVNEFLPWHDSQFDTVVSGTSLDHVFSLNRSLEEVRRVLKPDGLYLIWLGSFPGWPAFDEQQESFAAIDDFHLFHFERSWIEPLLERFFVFADVTIIPQVGFDHVFYCLKPRK